MQITGLGDGFPVIQGFDVVETVHTFDAHITHIADGKVAVQRLADADGISAPVVAGQLDV
ncbi:hypothetical protein D3C78_1591750 [compost metagenome]